MDAFGKVNLTDVMVEHEVNTDGYVDDVGGMVTECQVNTTNMMVERVINNDSHDNMDAENDDNEDYDNEDFDEDDCEDEG